MKIEVESFRKSLAEKFRGFFLFLQFYYWQLLRDNRTEELHWSKRSNDWYKVIIELKLNYKTRKLPMKNEKIIVTAKKLNQA